MDKLNMLKPSKRKRQKRRDKRMDEELIECYRKGWNQRKRKGYQKRYIGNTYQFAAKQERMKLRGGETKYFNDNLGPLKKFLHSKTGKHWDNVYSELCQKMDKSTVLGQHLIDHLLCFVEINVEIIDGKVYGHDGGFSRYELGSFGFTPKYYVHPKTGCLTKVKKKRKK